VSRQSVLILSPDSLSAALLGAAVELAGYAPHFPSDGQSARAALLHVRPRVVLVDCDHPEACSEAFIGPAMMTGASILVIRGRRSERDIRQLAEQLGVRVIEMPTEHATLMQAIQEAVAS
jgi:DNA-binding NtrC family response regulator